jgi:catechol 2,3-dioxygenase-like lactoylglutathione lyase family enzyme
MAPHKAAAWYVEMFGAKIVTDMPAMVILELPGSGAKLGISAEAGLPRDSADRHLGLEHFALDTDDVDKLLAKGLELLEPVRVLDSEQMEKAIGLPVEKIAYIRAPDDVRIELVQLRS